jgi:capsular polysaccharide biosynthesis protein
VELNEAARRILGSHRLLIVLVVLLGVAAALARDLAAPATFTSSARLVLDTSDPKSSSESAAIADGARAIATSPAQVALALHAVGQGGDPAAVARDVTVQALGSSAVLQLGVRDRDPRRAAALANALARQVIAVRATMSTGGYREILRQVQSRIDLLSGRIARAQADVDRLRADLANPPPGEAGNELRRRLEAATALRGTLTTQLDGLATQRDGLVAGNAQRPKPLIVDAATAPRTADPSRRIPDAILGGLLGLILGVGLAAFLESVRPTVAGPRAVATAVGAPLLGELAGEPDGSATPDVLRVAARLRLAAAEAGVRVVELVGAGPSAGLPRLATRLAEVPAPATFAGSRVLVAASLPTPSFGWAGSPTPDGPSAAGNGDGDGDAAPDGLDPTSTEDESAMLLRAFAASQAPAGARGLVVAAPPSLPLAELFDVQDLARITGWPLLGVIVCRARRGGSFSRGRQGSQARRDRRRGSVPRARRPFRRGSPRGSRTGRSRPSAVT